jgi:hypothetical protein
MNDETPSAQAFVLSDLVRARTLARQLEFDKKWSELRVDKEPIASPAAAADAIELARLPAIGKRNLAADFLDIFL